VSGGRRGTIALLVDWEACADGRGGTFVLPRHSAEWHVQRALAASGHRTAVVPFTADVGASVERLERCAPTLVFNLTEAIDGDRRMDVAIAGVLDLLKFPYTGSGPEALDLCRDKARSKRVVGTSGVEAPRFVTASAATDVRRRKLRFPVIVKPQFGDGGDGISRASLVRDRTALRQRVGAITRRLKMPAICEEFIAGRDLYVSMLVDGRGAPEPMPPMELHIGKARPEGPQFATDQLRHNPAYRTRWRVRWRRAKLAPALLTKVWRDARAAFAALGMRDYGRVDFRLSDDGELRFIEANPNHDLARHAFAINVCFAGVPYEAAIERIVAAALRRTRSLR
jgi:D-alanine-D-alanine ligase